MSNEDTVPVWFVWEGVEPDPIQYKPYSPSFRPDALAVQLNVPTKFVVATSEDEIQFDDDGKNYTVLTPEGMAWCCEQLSTGIIRIKTGAVR